MVATLTKPRSWIAKYNWVKGIAEVWRSIKSLRKASKRLSYGTSRQRLTKCNTMPIRWLRMKNTLSFSAIRFANWINKSTTIYTTFPNKVRVLAQCLNKIGAESWHQMMFWDPAPRRGITFLWNNWKSKNNKNKWYKSKSWREKSTQSRDLSNLWKLSMSSNCRKILRAS